MVLNPSMSYAQAASLSLSHAMQRDATIVAMGEDLGRGGVFGQYKGLLEQFGADRVIDTPISEAGIAGAAVGMALAGLRPVVEMRIIDFALCAMDEIVNQAAKNRYMFGGQGRVPIVMRMPIGMWVNSAAQHSQSLEAWFAHMPGVVVLCPATPQDNFDMLTLALQGDDPVVYLENKELWTFSGEVNIDTCLPLTQARVLRRGQHLTMVSWSAAVHTAIRSIEARRARIARRVGSARAAKVASRTEAAVRIANPVFNLYVNNAASNLASFESIIQSMISGE